MKFGWKNKNEEFKEKEKPLLVTMMTAVTFHQNCHHQYLIYSSGKMSMAFVKEWKSLEMQVNKKFSSEYI